MENDAALAANRRIPPDDSILNADHRYESPKLHRSGILRINEETEAARKVSSIVPGKGKGIMIQSPAKVFKSPIDHRMNLRDNEVSSSSGLKLFVNKFNNPVVRNQLIEKGISFSQKLMENTSSARCNDNANGIGFVKLMAVDGRWPSLATAAGSMVGVDSFNQELCGVNLKKSGGILASRRLNGPLLIKEDVVDSSMKVLFIDGKGNLIIEDGGMVSPQLVRKISDQNSFDPVATSSEMTIFVNMDDSVVTDTADKVSEGDVAGKGNQRVDDNSKVETTVTIDLLEEGEIPGEEEVTNSGRNSICKANSAVEIIASTEAASSNDGKISGIDTPCIPINLNKFDVLDGMEDDGTRDACNNSITVICGKYDKDVDPTMVENLDGVGSIKGYDGRLCDVGNEKEIASNGELVKCKLAKELKSLDLSRISCSLPTLGECKQTKGSLPTLGECERMKGSLPTPGECERTDSSRPTLGECNRTTIFCRTG
ncbi:hypothetical protein MA16_Dca019236 [Dendrobium catenatum]|uniref:Uncharacterized protein n=1 Tax=Dendrobium catenatum TaxID=906689 RepID=A0A2I0W3N7_9ASPA|nr:hypothetical protein MA16_Dca019236 [Dendrobium catenatum]